MKKIKFLFVVIFVLLFVSCGKGIKETVEISTSGYYYYE